ILQRLFIIDKTYQFGDAILVVLDRECFWNVNCDSAIEDATISSLDAPFLTGNVWRKSPPNMTDFPPNNWSGLSIISFRVLSNVSKQRRSFIGDSSQIIRSVSAKRLPACVFFLIPQMDSSVNSRGSLNLECVVRPAGKSKEAMPEDAIARTIFPYERREFMIVFQRNVFPVPP
ncbi:hypothetical protein Tco_0354574, partial [Tanacetum coccineum]